MMAKNLCMICIIAKLHMNIAIFSVFFKVFLNVSSVILELVELICRL